MARYCYHHLEIHDNDFFSQGWGHIFILHRTLEAIGGPAPETHTFEPQGHCRRTVQEQMLEFKGRDPRVGTAKGRDPWGRPQEND